MLPNELQVAAFLFMLAALIFLGGRGMYLYLESATRGGPSRGTIRMSLGLGGLFGCMAIMPLLSPESSVSAMGAILIASAITGAAALGIRLLFWYLE